jgi:hypothetical protein
MRVKIFIYGRNPGESKALHLVTVIEERTEEVVYWGVTPDLKRLCQPMSEKFKISVEAMEDLFVTAERVEISLNAVVVITREMPLNGKVMPERVRTALAKQEG